MVISHSYVNVYQRVTKSLINRHEQCETNPSIIPLNTNHILTIY